MSLRSRAEDETKEGMTILYANLRWGRILADCRAQRIAANFRPRRKFTYRISLRRRAEDEKKEGMTILYANLRVGRILNRNGKASIFRPTRNLSIR